MTIIHTKTKRFSPITDALYPYKALLIVSPQNRCFCYYGYGASQMHDIANAQWAIYYGGGINGYWGGNLKDIQTKDVDLEIGLLIESIKKKYITL